METSPSAFLGFELGHYTNTQETERWEIEIVLYRPQGINILLSPFWHVSLQKGLCF